MLDRSKWIMAWVTVVGSVAAQASWDQTPSLAGARYATAYDTVRDRIVLVTTDALGGPTTQTWEWDGGAWTPRATGGPNVAREPTLVFDEVSGLSLLVTADPGAWISTTWAWDGARWRVLPQSARIPARSHTAMAYDPAQRRVLLFGGLGGAGALEDTWEWDGATLRWQQVQPAVSPPARHGHGLAADPATGRVVLFGGEAFAGSSTQFYNDTWAWDGGTRSWALLSVGQAPPPTSLHGMALDLSRGRPVLQDWTGVLWSWDGPLQTWSQLSTTGPAPTALAELTYDRARQRLVAIGSANLDAATTWTLSSAGVWQVAALPDAPSHRRYAALAHDAARGELVLFGGLDDRTYLGETWLWDGLRWRAPAGLTEPAGRFDAAMTYDTAAAEVLLFGGMTLTGESNDLWSWNGTGWRSLQPTNPPAPRAGALMAFDPIRRRALLFGGYGGMLAINSETWEWDRATNAWRPLQPSAAPPVRFSSAMTHDASTGKIVLFGGYAYGLTGAVDLNDTWEWDGAVGTWSQHTARIAPPARSEHAMAFDAKRGRVVVTGGWSSSPLRYHDDAWEWDPAGSTWRQIASQGLAVGGHALAYHAGRERLVAYGGVAPQGGTNVAVTGTWSLAATAVATVSSYGIGCAPAGRVPQLTTYGPPDVPAPRFAFEVVAAPPRSPGALLVGGRAASLPLAGCRLLVDALGAVALPLASNAGGSASLPLPIPDRKSLLGLPLFAQAVVVDSVAPPAQLAFSRGVTALLGR